jgi:hypothetical protein
MGGIVASQQMILFYNAETLAGATALIDAGGVLKEQHEMAPGTFGAWTHLVSDGKFILFYNAETLAGATALIDAGGVLKEQHEMAPGTFGAWTHIVG